jgi:hypothetical protein
MVLLVWKKTLLNREQHVWPRSVKEEKTFQEPERWQTQQPSEREQKPPVQPGLGVNEDPATCQFVLGKLWPSGSAGNNQQMRGIGCGHTVYHHLSAEAEPECQRKRTRLPGSGKISWDDSCLSRAYPGGRPGSQDKSE